MANKINSASRLVSVIRRIPAHGDNTQVMSVWADCFEISETNQNKQGLAVVEKLAAMNRELGIMHEQMRAGGYREELYLDAFAKVEHAISPVIISAPWITARQHLTPEVLLALEFSSELIPDEESAIDQSELSEIERLVGELEDMVVGSNLPTRLQTLICHHVQLIRDAIAEYPIAGAKAFREAVRIAVGEIVEVRNDIEANPQSPEVGKLVTVWKRVSSAADLALKVDKLVQLGEKGWDALMMLAS